MNQLWDVAAALLRKAFVMFTGPKFVQPVLSVLLLCVVGELATQRRWRRYLTRTFLTDLTYMLFFATGTYPPSDPDATCPNIFFGPCENFPIDPVTGLPLRTEWGGMNFYQPHLMLRYEATENLSFKAGYRWYGYNLKQGTEADYKTHIITTSMVVTF